jgi:hypothetical protein
MQDHEDEAAVGHEVDRQVAQAGGDPQAGRRQQRGHRRLRMAAEGLAQGQDIDEAADHGHHRARDPDAMPGRVGEDRLRHEQADHEARQREQRDGGDEADAQGAHRLRVVRIAELPLQRGVVESQRDPVEARLRLHGYRARWMMIFCTSLVPS